MLKVLEVADILSKGTHRKSFELVSEEPENYVLTISYISYQGMIFRVYKKDGIFDRIVVVRGVI